MDKVSPIYTAAVADRALDLARWNDPDKAAANAWAWVSVADTARLIRAALAKAFPATRFYVRSHSYAGGASIDVYYDGTVPNTWTRVDSDDRPYGDPVTNYSDVDHTSGRWAALRKDGAPAKRDVDAVLAGFVGGRFDGMIDLAYSVRSWLNPDGSATLGRSSGSAGSMGSDPGFDFPAPSPDAVMVRFGADHVFVNDSLPYDVASKGRAA